MAHGETNARAHASTHTRAHIRAQTMHTQTHAHHALVLTLPLTLPAIHAALGCTRGTGPYVRKVRSPVRSVYTAEPCHWFSLNSPAYVPPVVPAGVGCPCARVPASNELPEVSASEVSDSEVSDSEDSACGSFRTRKLPVRKVPQCRSSSWRCAPRPSPAPTGHARNAMQCRRRSRGAE